MYYYIFTILGTNLSNLWLVWCIKLEADHNHGIIIISYSRSDYFSVKVVFYKLLTLPDTIINRYDIDLLLNKHSFLFHSIYNFHAFVNDKMRRLILREYISSFQFVSTCATYVLYKIKNYNLKCRNTVMKAKQFMKRQVCKFFKYSF